MSTFTIDADNNITAYSSPEDMGLADTEGLDRFDSQATLAKVSAHWPVSRFVDIWNSIPGQSPVRKFQDRKKAVARIWKTIQPLLDPAQPSESAKKAEPKPNAAKQAKKVKPAKKSPRATLQEMEFLCSRQRPASH